MAPPHQRLPGRGLLLVGAVLGVALVVALLATGYVQTRRAARMLVRGEVHLLMERVRESVPAGAALDEAVLARAVEAGAAEGLRAVAAVDVDGQVLRWTGAPVSGALPTRVELRPGDFEEVAPGRVRALGGLQPGRRRGGGPGPGGGGGQRVLIEFEPLLALGLDRLAQVTLGVGVALLAGLVALLVAALRLVTARDTLAQRLAHDEQLRALGEMSAVLAHEIRNPLASLKGHGQLLLDALAPGGRERAKAERVVQEARRLEALTQDLLSFARAGALERRAVDPAELVREVALATGGPRVTVDAEQAPARWSLDAPRLRQVLVNVVQNALEASGPDGPVEVSVTAAGGVLRLAVRDHGPGLPQGEEAAIFEPFHTGKVHGTGLGLAIARRLVELHGGRIHARTHEQGGALFTVELPEG